MMWFPAINAYAQQHSASLFLDTKSYMHENISWWTDHPRIIPVPEFPSICTDGILIFMAAETNAHRVDNDPLLVQTYQAIVRLYAPYGCIVVFEDTPSWERTPDLPVNPLQCIQGDDPLITCKKEKTRMVQHFESRNVPKDVKDIHIVDLIDTICPYPNCYAYNHTLPIWRDSHHLTVPMVNLMRDTIFQKIDAAPCVQAWKKKGK